MFLKKHITSLRNWLQEIGPSNRTILIIFLMAIIAILLQARWRRLDRYMMNDVKGYYAYLPAAFIYKDFEFKDFKDKIWYNEDKDGRPFIKYTCGNAICYFPGFLLAHTVALVSNYPADGYSPPYHLGIMFSALLFLMATLVLARSLLLRFFSERTTIITMLVIFLGTNYFHYATSYITYSHLFSFFFILLFIKTSIDCLERYTLRRALILGISAGMMSLIRPVDAIFLIFPFLYQVSSWNDLKRRLHYVVQHFSFILTSLLITLAIWMPQLYYNYWVFHKLTISGYTGERFFFNDPEWFKAMFSFNNGWLVYSPLMIFGLIGIAFYLRQKRWMWLFVLLLYTYVISSWWCWWYVGFGNRAFVNLSAFLLFPLAFALEQISQIRYLKRPLMVVIGFGILLNQFQNYQYDTGAIHYEAMTWKTYKSVWGKKWPTNEFFDQLEPYDAQEALNGVNAKHKTILDTIATYHFLTDTALNISKSQEFAGHFTIPIGETPIITAEVLSTHKPPGFGIIGDFEETDTCPRQSYGRSSFKKVGDSYKIRMYYRYHQNIVNCHDSIHFLFINSRGINSSLSDFTIHTIQPRDTLIYLE